MSNDHRGMRVLLTGAAGLIGQSVLGLLPPSSVVALVHRKHHEFPNGTAVVFGDVTKPFFGLGADGIRALGHIDVVIHAAAVTDIASTRKQFSITNTTGAEYALQVASALNARLCHVSTAFVHNHTANSDEDSYINSKLKAEHMIARSGIDHAIVRPSIVVGNSRDGMTPAQQGFHRILRMFVQGRLPIVVVDGSMLLDFVPNDVVARSIIAAAAGDFGRSELWLTAGERALRIGDVVEQCLAQSRLLLRDVAHETRIVSQDMYARLIEPVFLPQLTIVHQNLVRAAKHLFEFFPIREPFPSSYPLIASDMTAIKLPAASTTLAANLRRLAAQMT